MKNIVIRGMACQFPGARTLAEYWDIIKNNRISVQCSCSSPIDIIRNNIPGGYIENVDQFDAEFFGISNREATLMDPQQRLLLQNTWHAIENAGIAPEKLRGSKTGVFVGAMANDWLERSVDVAILNSQMITGNGLALLANRISYLFDFKGPSLTIDTACSSSLVALNLAIQSLNQNECDYAIVAGVNVIASDTLSKFYKCSGIASLSGLCKSFGNKSDGIVRSEGVGVLFLSRNESQIASYAEIVAGTINHNGLSNGITSPNRFSQQELISETLRKTELSSHDFSYIECHGAGTELGDRIELLALDSIIQRKDGSESCPIGSIKSLIGHTEAASGIAGIIKLALMLHYQYIPKSLYSNEPNPILENCKNINLPITDIQLLQEKNYMGISSFGLGGTNAHFIIKNSKKNNIPIKSSRESYKFVISAYDESSLLNQANGLLDFIVENPEYDLSDLSDLYCTLKGYQRIKIQFIVSNLVELEKKIKHFIQNPKSGDFIKINSSDSDEIKNQLYVNSTIFPFYRFKRKKYWIPNVDKFNLEHINEIDKHDDYGDTVIKIIANILNLNVKEIKLDSLLIDDLGLDSIIIIELIDKINEKLPSEKKITFIDTMHFKDVSDVIGYLNKQ